MVTVIKKTDTKRQIKRKVKPNGYSSQKKLFDAKKYNGILNFKASFSAPVSTAVS